MTHLASRFGGQASSHPSPVDPILAGAAGTSLAGTVIGLLTLHLNPELQVHLGDRGLVLLYGALFYGFLGALAGGSAGVVLVLARFARSAWAWPLGRLLTAACGLAPILLAVALPDVGVSSRLLVDLVFAGIAWHWILAIVSLLLGSLLGSWLLEGARRRVRGALRAPRRFYPTAWGLAMGSLAAVGLFSLPTTAARGAAAEHLAPSEVWPSAPSEIPRRVVLLCVDGLDPVVLGRLLDRGELPTLGRFVSEGSWGPLETLAPTLSAVVWTSIATGKSKAAHGIHHFLYSELPGLSGPILEFPLLTGLNFRILSHLERIPGMPRLQRQFTTQQRRVEALWNIVGRTYPVGVWRWLISWPAEAVPGFYASGGLGWAQFDNQGVASGSRRTVLPADAFRGIDRAMRPAGDRTLGLPGLPIDPRDPHWRPVVGLLGNQVTELLPALIDKYDPRFVAAAFYNLDVFQHFYGRSKGPEEQLIPAAYRFVDARLGELIGVLGEDTEVIVVSDHGFDFAHGHHAFAPPGVFLARGPAFAAGRRIEGLHVLDIAPLVLRLLDLPLAEDMPGTTAGRYRQGLSESFLRSHPERRITSWERHSVEPGDAGEMPLDEELHEVLKSLGYI